MNKKLYGITLIEITIVLSLLMLLVLALGKILDVSGHVFKQAEDEFKIQRDLRQSIQYVSHKVTKATGGTLLPELDPNKLSRSWSYIGIEYFEKNGKKYTRVVEYQWDQVQNKHIQKVLAESNDSITYSMEFKTTNRSGEDRNIKIVISSYAVKGYDPTTKLAIKGDKTEEINTSYESVNSIQVLDRGDVYNNTEAFAYKEDSREVQDSGANVMMVFDISGSMGSYMSGGYTRIGALKEAANKLVEKLSKYDNVLISSVLFDHISVQENDPAFAKRDYLPYTNPKNNKNEIELFIEHLAPMGATNTGDGIRVGYYKAKEQAELDKKNKRIAKNHFILMVDGDSNYSTMVDDPNGKYYEYRYVYYPNGGYNYVSVTTSLYTGTDQTEDYGGINNRYVRSKGPQKVFASTSFVDEYTRLMASKISELENNTSYLVRCGNGATAEGMKNIADGLGISIADEGTKYFDAQNTVKLVESFEKIGTGIGEGLWFVDGP